MSHASTPSTKATMHPLKGGLVVLAVAAVVVLFVTLNNALGIQEFWAGFLFLFYWAAIEHARFDKLAAAATGALVGLGASFALHALPAFMGGAGLTLALSLVVVLVYCQVMGWASLLVNNATMLFLTVGTVPHVQKSGDYAQIFVGLLMGVLFFGGLLALAGQLKKKPSAPVQDTV